MGFIPLEKKLLVVLITAIKIIPRERGRINDFLMGNEIVVW